MESELVSASASTLALDDGIENLQARVSSLKKQLRVQTSTLIAAPSTRELLSGAPRAGKLLAQAAAQEAHNQQCLYRACASITTFRVQDPDPNAVDGGAALGLRVEVVSRAKFLRPYYVLLNRPYPNASRHLRVHRHTVPPCIPLAGLAARHLPPPPAPDQGLARFARSLRREIVRYHHRLGVVADLRKAAGLGRKKKRIAEDEGGEEEQEEERQARGLININPADAEAKQLSIEWVDGRTGRLVLGDDGEILKFVAVGDNGRDRDAVRELLGGAARVDEVVERLASSG
ncbi:Cenp-O kinetochore centromere component-domain-containing protein [Lasiosphaeria miniovina]|uniref:Cenp-O kinetochore centromere component-domain-containing protein n=1 Tax=Lasiosphaeria miniovina TaxID=1954250 RepID=A0AA40DXC2_9PEZI|nr:Cenp-O kinetochore centromere component-domain-containing protein [Lasiosphaeria miniovina]KAK0717097.1 Cenp-O kinetochore centromere component-domain-containing protein [Lasiosphaeria miniovina]